MVYVLQIQIEDTGLSADIPEDDYEVSVCNIIALAYCFGIQKPCFFYTDSDF